MTLMKMHEVKNKHITIHCTLDTGLDERHWIELDTKKSYTTKQIGDIADTIKTYAQELDLIEKLY